MKTLTLRQTIWKALRSHTGQSDSYVSKRQEKFVPELEQQILQWFEQRMPKEKDDPIKQGEIIPFDNKKRVKMDWLRKAQSSGYNRALADTRKALRAQDE